MEPRRPYDKYELYERAVQDPPATCDFLENVFRETCRKAPKSLREDFCGSFALAHEWANRGDEYTAIAIDNEAKPLRYGKSRMEPGVRKRIKVLRKNVLAPRLPSADILCALNFSYCVFKKRVDLLRYLKGCYQSLGKKGILVLDVLGGVERENQLESRADCNDFSYFWQQAKFDPISREGLFYTHFQLPKGKKRLRQFVYDWRLYTVPELRDLLQEAGFKRSHVYWEGSGRLTDDDDSAQAFQSWVAYVVGEK